MVNKDELRKFCDDNLAYILDRGFKIYLYTANEEYISIFFYLNSTSVILNSSALRTQGINLNNISISTFEKFNWFHVCDDIMPFLQILVKKYQPCKKFLVLHGEEKPETWNNTITIKRAESGYNSFNRELYYIEINIKKL
jgi:hypothetical protein